MRLLTVMTNTRWLQKVVIRLLMQVRRAKAKTGLGKDRGGDMWLSPCTESVKNEDGDLHALSLQSWGLFLESSV